MKTIKIAITALFVSALMVLPSNSVEVRIGVSAGYAQLEASGTETLKDSAATTTTTEQANAVIPSMFAELAMDNGFGLGYDMISGSADLSGSTKTRRLSGGGTGDDSGTNKASAEVDGVHTVYLIKTFGSGLFVKAGMSSADVNTTEVLSSGSKYGNKSIDGKMYGVGFEKVNDAGIFFRAGVEYTDFDTINLTGDQAGAATTAFNKIKADVDMTSAKFSIGKVF
tara:strand:+ start:119 stop:793 length:675 start_codon:yes stop_codon:yes gene_type:complete